MKSVNRRINFVLGICLVFSFACSSTMEPDPPDPVDGPTFAELAAEGWTLFEAGNYASAVSKFQEAKNKDRGQVEGYVGLGWSHFKNGNTSSAISEFSFGNSQSGADADLFGGWAFALNAAQEYVDSNTQVDRALADNASWAFSHDSNIGANDLTLLKAENHFLLGNFSESLSVVQQLNTAFDADVSTSDGQSALAAEIERLQSAG